MKLVLSLVGEVLASSTSHMSPLTGLMCEVGANCRLGRCRGAEAPLLTLYLWVSMTAGPERPAR